MRRLFVGAATAAVLAGLGALVLPQVTPNLSKTTHIAMTAFKRLLQMEQVLVVDVRDTESYRAGHIPGAISMPFDQVSTRADELRRSGSIIVTYCA